MGVIVCVYAAHMTIYQLPYIMCMHNIIGFNIQIIIIEPAADLTGILAIAS